MPKPIARLPKVTRSPSSPQVRVPTTSTLRRYGLTADDWLAILSRQGGVCAVCRTVPTSGRLVTDHEHVKGWKKLPREERRRYVRGILCFFCNHNYVGRRITVFKAENVAEYLRRYVQRLNGNGEAK